MRASTKVEGTRFVTADEESKKNYFSEIVNSVTWASFSKMDSNQLVSRDYMNVKVWDIRRPGEVPLFNFKIFDFKESKLQELYDNEGIFDRFDVKVCPTASTTIMTGCYNDSFSLIDITSQTNTSLIANLDQRRYESNEVVR